MGAHRPGKNGKGEGQTSRQRGGRDIAAGIETQDAGNPAGRDPRQPFGHRIARRSQDPIGVIDDRLAKLFGQAPGGEQDVSGLVDFRDQIDNDIELAKRGDPGLIATQKRQRIDVIKRVLEKILDRRVAVIGRVERQQPKIRRRLNRPAPDQRPDRRSRRVSRPGGFKVTGLALDAADPVATIGMIQVQRGRPLKILQSLLGLARARNRPCRADATSRCWTAVPQAISAAPPWPPATAPTPSAPRQDDGAPHHARGPA